jgi:hypothetical protein
MYAVIPNFGKVEYFCGEGLTGGGVFCPTGHVCSPDGAKRNPGNGVRTDAIVPDCASLRRATSDQTLSAT